jgi:hypothetical protein
MPAILPSQLSAKEAAMLRTAAEKKETAMLGNAAEKGAPKSGTPQLGPLAAGATTAMIKSVGGLQNWYKLFPVKTGAWTQVAIAQIRTVEANQMPKPLNKKPAQAFKLAGDFQVAFGLGIKSGATYALVTRKDPARGTLFAWYARDVDIARIIGSGLKKVNNASADYATAAAQEMAVQASVAAASANLQGGASSPNVPITPGVGLSVPKPTGPVKIPPLAWYEVTAALINKVEGSLPFEPSKAPLPMPKGPDFTAELLAGPRNKWPYAKVVANINGAYLTMWFTIGAAGKNKPGSIIFLKRPKVAGITPNPVLLPDAGYAQAGYGVQEVQALPALPLTPPLAEEDNFMPPGYLLEGEGPAESIAAPWWKNPLFVGAAVIVLAGGAWVIYKKK